MPTLIEFGQQLIRTFNLQNVSVLPQPKNDYQISQAATIDKALYSSALGTPVLADLTLGNPKDGAVNSYADDNGNIIAFPTIKFVTVLITINQTKNIVKTQIQGRAGTVKEYVGLGDYQVTINGILTNLNGSYPKDQLVALKDLLIAPISIEATSWFLQIFGIDYLVIDSFDIEQGEGEYSQQAFSISASSDNEVQLVVQ